MNKEGITDEDLLERIARKMVILARLAISDEEKGWIRNVIRAELEEFRGVDILKAYFGNKYRHAFPSLFLALCDIWSKMSFRDYLAVLEDLDGYPDKIVPWVFYAGQYMGIDALKAAQESGALSSETKTFIRNRLKKGTPQPLARHFEELANWQIDFDAVHQQMVRTGGPKIPKGHDYYQATSRDLS